MIDNRRMTKSWLAAHRNESKQLKVTATVQYIVGRPTK